MVGVRAFSFGGGQQSMAALVLAAQERIDFRLFVFANVGDESEHPKTLDYITEVAGPYAERHGLQLHEVRATRFKQPDTLMAAIERRKTSVVIPMRLDRTGAPARRICTHDFKVAPIARWMAERGASAATPGVVGLGISMDEFHRMKSESSEPAYTLEYPLITLRLRREDCQRIITDAGLPLPVKSSCWFCPWHSKAYWARQRREEPTLFARSVELERSTNARLAEAGKPPAWLTDSLKPLDQVVGDQMTLDEAIDTCETGFCEITGDAA